MKRGRRDARGPNGPDRGHLACLVEGRAGGTGMGPQLPGAFGRLVDGETTGPLDFRCPLERAVRPVIDCGSLPPVRGVSGDLSSPVFSRERAIALAVSSSWRSGRRLGG